jgi:Acetyltransferase (GNAT) domain
VSNVHVGVRFRSPTAARPLATDEAMCARLVNLADRARADAGIASLEVHADLPGHVHRQTRGVSHLLSRFVRPRAHIPDLQPFTGSAKRPKSTTFRVDLATWRIDRGPDVLLYNLHVRTRRRLGIPVQPRYFFDHLWRHVIAPERGFVLVAYCGSVPVAGTVFLTVGPTIVYKFGAPDPSAWPLRPNHLLFSDAIRGSCENGFATFDFGRSEFDNQVSGISRVGGEPSKRPCSMQRSAQRLLDGAG